VKFFSRGASLFSDACPNVREFWMCSQPSFGCFARINSDGDLHLWQPAVKSAHRYGLRIASLGVRRSSLGEVETCWESESRSACTAQAGLSFSSVSALAS
jgi:hypothetical protein